MSEALKTRFLRQPFCRFCYQSYGFALVGPSSVKRVGWGLVVLLFSGSAAVANCADGPFVPATPPLSFSTPGASAPIVLLARPLVGCVGKNGGLNKSGGTASPGQRSGTITIDASQALIFATGGDAVGFNSKGGPGGTGGRTGANLFGDLFGGGGGDGGLGGEVKLTFSGSVSGAPMFVFSGQSSGGDAGPGGFAQGGVGGHTGGPGGRGGNGVVLSFAIETTGPLKANNGLLTYASRGGSGGAGGNAGGGIGLGRGGNGGAGGTGGAIAGTFAGTGLNAPKIASITASGGRGGNGGTPDVQVGATFGGDGGAGGAGGTSKISVAAIGDGFSTGQDAISTSATGGDGGNGSKANFSGGGNAGSGGAGGTGGTSEVTTHGRITSGKTAVTVTAYGGTGGAGGQIDTVIVANGGRGGPGGTGGTAKAVVSKDAELVSTGGDTGQLGLFGVLVQANGGAGGAGGKAGSLVGTAGGGGFGGAGGTASAQIDGKITTGGAFSHATSVQSVGGVGGAGANATGVFFSTGGQGFNGGDGGTAALDASGTATVLTEGEGAIGLVVQSVGGGGGLGGDALAIPVPAGNFSVSFGGNGGLGGDGKSASVTLGSAVVTSKPDEKGGGGGVLAQSVGGAGGVGGSAGTEGSSVLTLALGGDGGKGGASGPSLVHSDAIITTFGDHASGITAQSIGGGGGKAGAGLAFNVTVLPIAIGIGGAGGGGGPGGAATVNNTNQVVTYGPNAGGILAQSVGGGGGHGGVATSTAIALSPNKKVPAVSVTVAIGGKGGVGNTGGATHVDNAGLVATAGHGAPAVIAQSVGGGGGFGGDATASSFSAGSKTNISVSVALGGSAGQGGTGGDVTASNSGLLTTVGQDAVGLLAQSVGGGGGFGGGGDASAASQKGKTLSLVASLAIGGTGGTGGNAGKVDLFNSGGIATRGDGADGVFAQSIGGGGGFGGGGVGKANGKNLSVDTAVGGAGGAGGNGSSVSVTSFNSIATIGTDAAGITAQSVGGGGGRGGKGGATTGGAPKNPAAALVDTISNGLNLGLPKTDLGNGVVQLGKVTPNAPISVADLQMVTGEEPKGGRRVDGSAESFRLAVAVGGSGGAAGNGGTVKISNSAGISTAGALSDGIFAQSVGGGGGIGGAASSSSKGGKTAAGSLALGGDGGAGGLGGDVTIQTFGVPAIVSTDGVSAMGVFAQSVGGGGGKGKMANAIVTQSDLGFSLSLAGKGGASGKGGKVSVIHAGKRVMTTGKHAVGILAQSVGGGGGTAHVISTDQTGRQDLIQSGTAADLADSFNIGLGFGGGGSGGGDGGAVTVGVTPQNTIVGDNSVQTMGRNAHGILAQSIGGGGGFATGGQTTGTDFFAGGVGGAGGNGGAVDVTVGQNSTVSTMGTGAVGLWAQSVGGGGGIGGDIGTQNGVLAFSGTEGGKGDGNAIVVTADGGVVQTTGRNAPAILAQSVGGGGGLVATPTAWRTGTSGGEGRGGPVTITLKNGARVVANGLGSDAIRAQSDGQTTRSIAIAIDPTSSVTGGDGGWAVVLNRGTANRIDNAGTITTVNGPEGKAIFGSEPAANTTIANTGTITGDIRFLGGDTAFGAVLNNRDKGVVNTGAVLDLGEQGTLNNAGLVSIGGAGHIARTTFIGDFEQSETGRLEFDLDLVNDSADFLEIDGNASFQGRARVNAITLLKRDITLAHADDSLSVATNFEPDTSQLFSFSSELKAKTLSLRTDADFVRAAGVTGANSDLAANLQTIWDSGDPGFGTGFAALSEIESAEEYATGLDSLSGRAVSAVAASRFETSLKLVNSAFSCPRFVGGSAVLEQENCSWMRIEGSDFTRDAVGDSIDYSGRSTITMIGGQYGLDSGWFLGGVLGYENSRYSSVQGATNVDGQAGLGVLALKRQIGPLLIGGAVDFGYGTYDSRRTISFGSTPLQAASSRDVFSAGLHFKASYQRSYGAWYVAPQLDLDMAYLRLGGYQETGAGAFNLDVSRSDDILYSAKPAIRVGRRIDLAGGATMNAFALAGFSVRSGNDWQTNARFTSTPSHLPGFSTTLDTPDSMAHIGAGIEVYNNDNFSFRVQYDADLASDYLSHRAELRLSMRF